MKHLFQKRFLFSLVWLLGMSNVSNYLNFNGGLESSLSILKSEVFADPLLKKETEGRNTFKQKIAISFEACPKQKEPLDLWSYNALMRIPNGSDNHLSPLTGTGAGATVSFSFDSDTDMSTMEIERCLCQEQCLTATLVSATDAPCVGETLQVQITRDGDILTAYEDSDFGPTDSNGEAQFCFSNTDQVDGAVEVTVRVKP